MNKEELIRKEHYSYEDFRAVIRILRRECPWDKVQTHQSIRRCVIEEAYEVAEGIDRNDPAILTEELGDLMMQVLFHADYAEEHGEFTLTDVYDHVCRKLIFRHPHVFGGAENAESATEQGWEAIKRREKGQKTPKEEMRSIARTLPALTRAEKIAGKMPADDPQKQKEELLSKLAALPCDKSAEQEMGELLFGIAALAKALKIDPEAALTRKNDQIIE